MKIPKTNKLEFGFSNIGILSDLQQRVLLPIFPNIQEHGIPFSDLILKEQVHHLCDDKVKALFILQFSKDELF